MSVALLMNSTCDIQTQTDTQSALGGVIKGYTTTATGVPCRVHDMPPDQVADLYDDFSAIFAKVIYFATDPGVSPSVSRIVWEGYGYTVDSVQNAGGNLNRLYKVIAIRKPGGQ